MDMGIRMLGKTLARRLPDRGGIQAVLALVGISLKDVKAALSPPRRRFLRSRTP